MQDWLAPEEDAMSVSAAHKMVFGRLYQGVWNDRKLEYIEQIFAKTHALSAPMMAGAAVGPAVYRRHIEEFLKAFPDLKFTVNDTISEKDKLVVDWTITGTHKGEFLGVPGTNKKVSISGITINQIADGKIIESNAAWDSLNVLRQFGVASSVKPEAQVASGS
jgi:steroid delta-isomerase-like uncharacterized protein